MTLEIGVRIPSHQRVSCTLERTLLFEDNPETDCKLARGIVIFCKTDVLNRGVPEANTLLVFGNRPERCTGPDEVFTRNMAFSAACHIDTLHHVRFLLYARNVDY